MPTKCQLNSDGCVSLYDILTSFSGPISHENAWALCYQCAKCFSSALSQNKDKCLLVSDVKHVLLHKDGTVHPNTIFAGSRNIDSSRRPLQSELMLVKCLGRIIYTAVDFGYGDDEERSLSPELEDLITYMINEENDDSEADRHQETDDEGIERDSGECDSDHAGPSSLNIHTDQKLLDVLELCARHVGHTKWQQADAHYRAVCRALVTETLELSTFLQKVSSSGTRDLRVDADPESCSHLDKLNFSDWARFWVQVIGELRMGVKLKKVDFNRTPIEYELTPYEILMDDIRSRRYKLRKIMVDGDIPHRVKKDAHAVILEFIRSRPPLRKASERKLAPLRRQPSAREQLLDSIKRGRKLRPTSCCKNRFINDTPKRCENNMTSETPEISNNSKPTRRLIKVDFSVLQIGDDDDDEDEPESPTDLSHCTLNTTSSDRGLLDSTKVHPAAANPWRRTGSHAPAAMITHDEYHQFCDNALESYDLATQCPSRRASMRRHTIVSCAPELPVGPPQCHSVPQSRPTSRPGSRLSHESSDTDSAQLGTTLPEMSWSRSSLQDELLQSKQWQEAMSLDDRLSLTLEEIVHIRSVLTKAELEGLPVEGHVKEDVEKRKVCFLCLKTRFGIFGPWGQRCKLCKRTVCAKCHSKMRIPTEHFSNVPVVLLSPSLMSSPEEETKDSFPRSLMARLMVPEQQNTVRNSVGSAPNSPSLQRGVTVENGPSSAPGSRVESRMATSMEGPVSLPADSPTSTISERRSRMARTKTLGRPTDKASDRLKGMQMIVCHDCKTMIRSESISSDWAIPIAGTSMHAF